MADGTQDYHADTEYTERSLMSVKRDGGFDRWDDWRYLREGENLLTLSLNLNLNLLSCYLFFSSNLPTFF